MYRVEVGQPGVKWRMFQEQCRKEQRGIACLERKAQISKAKEVRTMNAYACTMFAEKQPTILGCETSGTVRGDLYGVGCLTLNILAQRLDKPLNILAQRLDATTMPRSQLVTGARLGRKKASVHANIGGWLPFQCAGASFCLDPCFACSD